MKKSLLLIVFSPLITISIFNLSYSVFAAILIILLGFLALYSPSTLSLIFSYSLGIYLSSLYLLHANNIILLLGLIPPLILVKQSIEKLDVYHPYKIKFKMFGPTSIIVILSSLMVLPLSYATPNMIIMPLTYIIFIIGYVYHRYNLLRKFEVKHLTISVVRDDEGIYNIKIGNDYNFNIYISLSSDDGGYRVSFRPSRLKLAQKTTESIQLHIYGERIGRHNGKINMSIEDQNGILTVDRSFPIEVVVKPKISMIAKVAYRLLEAAGLSIGEYAEATHTKFLGRTHTMRVGEFMGCRDYIPGDDPRSINIKKSVSRHKLIVKEYEPPSAVISLLILDLSINDMDFFDDALYLTFIITMKYIEEGRMSLGIIIFNSDGYIYRIKPTNPIHVLRILLNKLPDLKPEQYHYKYDLSTPNIESLLISENPYAKAELEILGRRYINSIISDIIRWIEAEIYGSPEIYMICRGSRNSPIYPIAKYLCERRGYSVKIVKDV